MKLKCLEQLCSELLLEHPAAKLPQDFTIAWEPCPSGMNGDITVTIFRLIFKFFAIGFNIFVNNGLRD
jgi:hypothetical protein